METSYFSQGTKISPPVGRTKTVENCPRSVRWAGGATEVGGGGEACSHAC